MPKHTRLTGAAIRRLPPQKRLNSALFSVSVSGIPHARALAACSVSKKVSPKATVRNLVKRRMRSILSQLTLPHGAFVFTAKRQSADASFAETKQDLESLVARLHGALAQ